MRLALILSGLFLLLSSPGCLPDTAGVDPQDDRMNYPAGIAMAGEDHLIVANSNFDLTYNSGTLIAIDLRKLHAIEQEFKDNPDLLSDDCAKKTKTYLSKDCKRIYVPPSKVIDTDNTIHIGSFASDLQITPNGDRAIIPIRSKNKIVIVDINVAGDGSMRLDCGQGSDKTCDSAHQIGSNDQLSLPIEPYEVASLLYKEMVDGVETITTLGFATHLAGGEVSVFKIDQGGKLAAELIGVATKVIPGASGIAVKSDPDHDPYKQEIYVSGRNESVPHLEVLMVLSDSANGSISRNPFFGSVNEIDFSQDIYGGTDARGIAVQSSGTSGYLITRQPEALLELDTESRKLINLTTVGADPSIVALYENDQDTPDPADDVAYAYVLCFLSNQVYIVDTRYFDMAQVVRSTGKGPHAITFDKKRKRAYIANFRESTITIIKAERPFDYPDVLFSDPKAPGQTIRATIQIGKPKLPKGHS
jgi:hypothetical protein